MRLVFLVLRQDVKSVRFHPHDDTLVSCSYDDSVKVWEDDEAGDWHCSSTLTAHKATVRPGSVCGTLRGLLLMQAFK